MHIRSDLRHLLVGRFGKMEMELAAEVIWRLSGEDEGEFTRAQAVAMSPHSDQQHILVGLDELAARGWLKVEKGERYQTTTEFVKQIRQQR